MGKGTIVYIGGFEMPDKNAAAHRVLNNGKVLRILDFNVVFIGITHSSDKIEQKTYDCFECWAIPYPKSTLSWINYLTDAKDYQSIVKKYSDVVGLIFYNYQSVALLKGMRYCKKNNIFCVADTTEWYLASSSNIAFNLMKQADTSLRMRYIQPKMDGIIAISSYLYNYYNRKGCNLIQIPPLIDKEEGKWKVDVHPRVNNKIQLVYAGNPGDIKDNLSLVISVVSQYRDFLELYVLGNINENDIPDRGDNVFLCGRVSHQKCIEMISNSDFQIFLRSDNLVTRAGFPTKLGESFACGTPVITTVHSNVCDYLIEGKNAFILHEVNASALDTVLKRIIRLDKAEINEMKSFCKQDTRFDYHTYEKGFKGFINSMLNDSEYIYTDRCMG